MSWRTNTYEGLKMNVLKDFFPIDFKAKHLTVIIKLKIKKKKAHKIARTLLPLNTPGL